MILMKSSAGCCSLLYIQQNEFRAHSVYLDISEWNCPLVPMIFINLPKWIVHLLNSGKYVSYTKGINCLIFSDLITYSELFSYALV